MLTDQEKSWIMAFVENQSMYQSVRKALLLYIEKKQPFTFDDALKYNDSDLGSIIRMTLAAKDLVIEQGFKDLLAYRKVEQSKKENNPAV